MLILFLHALAAMAQALPNGYVWGCLNISKTLPFCDHTLPTSVRVDDLVARMTLTEKLGLIGPDTSTGV